MTRRLLLAGGTFLAVGVIGCLVLPLANPKLDLEAAGARLFPIGLIAGIIVFVAARPKRPGTPGPHA